MKNVSNKNITITYYIFDKIFLGDKKHRFDNLNLDFNPPQSPPPSGGAIQSQWNDANVANENPVSKNKTINVAGPGIVGTDNVSLILSLN